MLIEQTCVLPVNSLQAVLGDLSGVLRLDSVRTTSLSSNVGM
jgi:hypothetical protein